MPCSAQLSFSSCEGALERREAGDGSRCIDPHGLELEGTALIRGYSSYFACEENSLPPGKGPVRRGPQIVMEARPD